MMTRGFPVSFVLHALALVLLAFYGNQTARMPVQTSRTLNVKLVTLPQTRPADVQPQTQPMRVREETRPELPPKELPKPKPKEKEAPPPKPREERREPTPKVAGAVPTETDTAPAAAVSSPAVTTTDTDFPFAWYKAAYEAKIIGNFRPRQKGFGQRAVLSCAVHFYIGRTGRVSRVTLVRNSGVGVFDREALRAVQTTRLPPLPQQYRGTEIGVTFVFKMEPGS